MASSNTAPSTLVNAKGDSESGSGFRGDGGGLSGGGGGGGAAAVAGASPADDAIVTPPPRCGAGEIPRT